MARKRKLDAKAATLAETRTLNPRPEAVRDEQFGSSEFFDARDRGAGEVRDGAPGAGGRRPGDGRRGRVRVFPALVL